MEQTTEREPDRRRRTRSRTPGLALRVSAGSEVNGDQEGNTEAKSKKTSVTTIQEEVTTTKSRPRGRPPRVAVVTSDYSSEGNTSPPSPTSTKQATISSEEKSVSVVTTTVTKSSSSSTTSATSQLIQSQVTKTSTAAAAAAAATTQQLSSSPTKREVRQNEINRVLEDVQSAILQTSTPKAGSSLQQKKATLTPEELSQHAAYKEYKEAGEYWNKFPKTDYTYSVLSPFRREIAPGMVAMPNMSRPGLNKHAERINVMIQQNPEKESYIRKRYSTSVYASGGKLGGSFAVSDPYDSGDERLDLSKLSSRQSKLSSKSHHSSYQRHEQQQQQQEVAVQHRSILSRFFLAIVNLFYSSTHSVSRLFNRSEHNLYYTRIEDERGFFVKTYSFFNALLTGIFKKVYLLISSVLFLDTFLLQTSASDVQQGRRKRRFLLILLILLPFLLFGGIYLYLDPTSIQSLHEHLSIPNFQLELPSTDGARDFALEKWHATRELTEYYFDNLKLFSANAFGEIRKIWQENVNNLF